MTNGTSLLQQVRHILENHPDATMADVEGLVTLNGQKATSIKQTYYIVRREMGKGSPPRPPRVKQVRMPATITARQIASAQRLLNAAGSLDNAVNLLRLVWQVKKLS